MNESKNLISFFQIHNPLVTLHLIPFKLYQSTFFSILF
jgi:hypothetical protein